MTKRDWVDVRDLEKQRKLKKQNAISCFARLSLLLAVAVGYVVWKVASFSPSDAAVDVPSWENVVLGGMHAMSNSEKVEKLFLYVGSIIFSSCTRQASFIL